MSRKLKCLPLFILIAAACQSITDDGGDGPSVRGTWSYSATQVTPPVEQHGTFTVTRQEGNRFDASIEVQERDAQGTLVHRSGIVSGRTFGGDGIDFDAFFDVTARRHVGRVVGDSINGSWAELDATPRSGDFHARRMP